MATGTATGRVALTAASRVVVRTPVLAFDVLTAWGGAGGPRDAAALRADLVARAADPLVREAIFVSSPGLDTAVDAWLADPANLEHREIEYAVIRYLSRMAGRSTPFGVLSSVGAGGVDRAPTRLVLAGRDRARRRIRLDNDYLATTCAALAADPALRAGLRYAPNTSLFQSNGRLRYAEARLAGGRSYHLVVVEPTDYLLALLERARDGATLAELVAVLCTDPEVEPEQAEEFLGEVIAAQILVPDLDPPVTGPEPLAPVIERLAALPGADRHAAALRAAGDAMAAIEATPLGAPPARYRAIAAALADGAASPPRIDRLFQVDLFRDAAELTIGPPIVDALARAVDLLARIGGASTEDAFARFRTQFSERYETREVPLVDVLDEETGIGFGPGSPATAPLLDIPFPARAEPRRVPWGRRELYLLGLIDTATRTGATELELTAADQVALGRDTPARLGELLSVQFAIGGESAEAIAAGRFSLRVIGIDTPSTRMLGRFCHGSPAIDALVREVHAIEERRRPDAVFAEIVHLPEGRLGNILLRPVLRDHEIVFLGTSGAPRANQIPATDLLVSIAGDRVVLRSRRLGKEIVPRLTSAHNYSRHSLGIYRFLCSLALQDGGSAGWSWGAVGDAPFVPRIRVGNLVLSRARWQLSAAEIAALAGRGGKAGKAGKSASGATATDAAPAAGFDAVTALRARRGLPRWILLSDSDNELPVDLDNRLAVDSFIDLIGNRPIATITEMYPPPDQLALRGPDGVYAHELQLLFSRDDAPPPRPVRAPGPAVTRSFPPGSRWLYLKYYAGHSTVDHVLRAIGPVVRELIAAGVADRWFFLRYGDPDWHLRLRLSGDPAALLGRALPALEAAVRPLADGGAVWRTQVDTYEREVERYGGAAAIEVAERLFAADSDAALAIVEAYSGDDGAQLVWQLAARGVDRLLDDLGLAFADKRAVVTRMRDQLGTEVGMDTEFQKRLGEKYRRDRAALENALADAPSDDDLAAGVAALAARTPAIRACAGELEALRAAGALTAAPTDLATSYMHMHVNRMLAATPRQQELVLYDLLRRHYDAISGRAKQAERERTRARPENGQ